jgi:hypothetical protein
MTAIHRLPGRPHQGHTRRGDSFCHAYLELEPAIRDFHRQAKLAMLAADDPSEYPDEDGDNLAAFAADRLADMVAALKRQYYELIPKTDSN